MPFSSFRRDRLPGAVSQACVGEAAAQADKRRGSPPGMRTASSLMWNALILFFFGVMYLFQSYDECWFFQFL
jgi:hypothetical protein